MTKRIRWRRRHSGSLMHRALSKRNLLTALGILVAGLLGAAPAQADVDVTGWRTITLTVDDNRAGVGTVTYNWHVVVNIPAAEVEAGQAPFFGFFRFQTPPERFDSLNSASVAGPGLWTHEVNASDKFIEYTRIVLPGAAEGVGSDVAFWFSATVTLKDDKPLNGALPSQGAFYDLNKNSIEITSSSKIGQWSTDSTIIPEGDSGLLLLFGLLPLAGLLLLGRRRRRVALGDRVA